FWEEHAVHGREGGLRQFNHPRDGLLAYEQIAFALAGRPDFKLVMLMPTVSKAKTRGRPKRDR
ncbi:MAG: hypothetical protein ACHQHK_13635, partial [Dongiales bacterium]